MAEPKNPQNILIKNKYYPQGLNEASVWKYYRDNKGIILDQVKGRDVMFFVSTDVNDFVVKRKDRGKFISLNNRNYDDLVHGRVVSIHAAMGRSEEFGIIDIDTDNFKRAQEAAIDVYNFVVSNIHPVTYVDIKYTGKTGFHINCYFKRSMNIDSIRYLLFRYLSDSYLANKYNIGEKRKPMEVNLDLSSNKHRGNYIILYSLSVYGLKSMSLTPREVFNFDPGKAKIKTVRTI